MKIAVLALFVCTLSACESVPGTSAVMPSRLRAVDQVKLDGKVAIRVGSDSSAQRLYSVGTAETTLGLAGLAAELVQARKSTSTVDTVFVYTEPGARGFDVLMALKAARAAGFKEVVAWADYTYADPSKSEPKRWTQSLSQIDGTTRATWDSGVVKR